MGDVLRQRRFADAVGADQNDVGGIARGSRASSARRWRRGRNALGQFQSKSQSGLKRPIWASLQSPLQAAAARVPAPPSRAAAATQARLATSRQCASSPCRLQRSGAGAQCVGLSHRTLLELVIGFERMRPHRRVTRLHMRGQLDGDRRRFATLFAPAFEREAHRIRDAARRAPAPRGWRPAGRRRRSGRAAASARW